MEKLVITLVYYFVVLNVKMLTVVKFLLNLVQLIHILILKLSVTYFQKMKVVVILHSLMVTVHSSTSEQQT